MSPAAPENLPSLTAVVCTRNRPEMLARLLASIKECAAGVDVLVVDSASETPRTMEVAAEAGFRAVRVDRPGLSVARNAGIAAATSELIAFTDDDCIVRDRWVDALAERFRDPRVGVVTGRMLDADAPAGSAPVVSPRQARRTVDGLDLGHGANMAFRRSAVLELGGFDDFLGAGTELAGAEDLDMFCRLLRAGWHGAFEPRSEIHHAHTRDDADYVRLMHGYARGAGASLAKMIRVDRSAGADMAIVQGRRVARRLLLGSSRRGGRRVALAHATGLAAGFRTGMALPLADETFAEPGAARSGAA
ncbi:glycosyltransferase [Modestobacter sp. VKM Ac-2983]|uniref:glycosyltransferase n=1 Tax=Modestobacter sp. VKM Ac-2983 TaxID=3004137 RepID=UPI0022AB5D22|nr:glycosyltransferase [Modestobacter sp. VKM Ac-2983]MCZ2803682.1 glycosyltransferase [Modestobacter sp. VKM Ac-2983]